MINQMLFFLHSSKMCIADKIFAKAPVNSLQYFVNERLFMTL